MLFYYIIIIHNMYCMIIYNIQSQVLYKIILRHMIYSLNSFLLKDTSKNMHAVTYRSRDHSKTATSPKVHHSMDGR